MFNKNYNIRQLDSRHYNKNSISIFAYVDFTRCDIKLSNS